MTEGLFISYRRSDTQSATGRLADHLRQNGFGEEGDMFLDIDHRIPPGVDFRVVINETLAGCDLVIVVIGRHWVDASDSEGRQRLDRPSDTHRLEVAAALKSAARVIPVLVEGASHPTEEDLPDDLKVMAFLQSWVLGERNYSKDVETLADLMLDARLQMEAERGHAERERTAAEQAEREQVERGRAAVEQVERGRAAVEQVERERAAAEQVERERAAAEQVERERAAVEQAEREQAAAELFSKWAALRDSGVLTEDEFQAQTSDIAQPDRERAAAGRSWRTGFDINPRVAGLAPLIALVVWAIGTVLAIRGPDSDVLLWTVVTVAVCFAVCCVGVLSVHGPKPNWWTVVGAWWSTLSFLGVAALMLGKGAVDIPGLFFMPAPALLTLGIGVTRARILPWFGVTAVWVAATAYIPDVAGVANFFILSRAGLAVLLVGVVGAWVVLGIALLRTSASQVSNQHAATGRRT